MQVKVHVTIGISLVLLVLVFGALSRRINTLEEEKADLLWQQKSDAALRRNEHEYFAKELEKAYASQAAPQPCTLKVDRLQRVICN